MRVIDAQAFDFSERMVLPKDALRLTATVANEHQNAILHVGFKSNPRWLHVFPLEFALAPGAHQVVEVTLTPHLADGSPLTPTVLTLYGQFLAVNPNAAELLPNDVEIQIPVLPPLATCPGCDAELPDGSRECRKCGERIRLCPICATPNSWLVTNCRLNPDHVLRWQADWLTSPGGNAAHDIPINSTINPVLARLWSSPTYPPRDKSGAWEWCAPIASFGMAICSAIDSSRGASSIHAFEIETGSPLWDFDLPDSKGVYPDRGSLTINPSDGMVIAATLAGNVVALDSIRGTLKWLRALDGEIYGGLICDQTQVYVPRVGNLTALNRQTGDVIWQHALDGRLDTAPTLSADRVIVATDDGTVTACSIADGRTCWQQTLNGEYNASPIAIGDQIVVCNMLGEVHSLSRENGAVTWRAKASTQAISVTPGASHDGLLYVAADDGFVHVMSAGTGNIIRSRRISASPLRTSPVVAGHTVLLGADDGCIYSLDSDYNVQRVYETTAGARINGAGLCLYGDIVVFSCTNGVTYALRSIKA